MAKPTPVTVTARRLLDATPRALFDTLVDPDRLALVRGVAEVKVLSEGRGGPTGPGTRRRVRLAGGVLLFEELLALEPPHVFDYRLLDASTPLDHRFGRIEFRRSAGRTEAAWTSTYAVGSHFLGPALTHASRLPVHAAFHLALGALDAQAVRAEKVR